MTPSRPGPGGPAIAGTATASTATAGTTGVVLRHALPDRLFHWLSAACVLTLLATAFLPILGVQFAWVTVHWVTGLVLAAAVLFHVVRVTARVTFGQMWVGRADIADAVESVRAAVARRLPAGRPGKYSVAQKLIHHAFAAVVLTTLVTGGFMLARIDTPWWQRNPYFLGEQAWAAVYVLHGLAALLLITMVMMHVYFALRPEKLKFTRAMIRGWITRQEFAESHDPNRWQVDR
jgi:cytochrome b subunit of formate dehydrogenase